MTRFLTPVSVAALIALVPLAAQAEAPVKTSWGTIAEPSYPAKVCATLSAEITTQNGSIDAYDADGIHTQPDHDRIQKAIDNCSNGAVKLVTIKGADGFLSGPLILKSGVILWIDKGATLYASRDPRDYDNGPGDCGIANLESHKSCHSLIEGRDLVNSGLVGEGRIDGRGGSLLLSGPNKGLRSWWDVAWQSKQGQIQHVFRMVQLEGGSNLTLYKLTFANSPNFHLVPIHFDGITAWGIKILTPTLVYTRPGYDCPEGSTPDKLTPATCFTPETVKNTDGFDPVTSTKVLLAYSYISTGDDNVAIKGGSMGKLSGVSRNHVYTHNQFYHGHGMSIGSETYDGVEDIQVLDLALDGMESGGGNGLRIKSDSTRGGKVSNILFDGVCMRNEVRPMVFDTRYGDKTGTKYPNFTGIVVRDFHNLGSAKFGGGTLTFRGFNEDGQKLPLNITFETVVFDGAAPKITGGKGKDAPFAAHIAIKPGATAFGNLFQPSAENDVTIEPVETLASPALRDCSKAFVPLKSVLVDSPI